MAARKKNKRKALTSTLKYELYGIIIIIFSVIAMSREGSVGRSFTYLFRFLIGTLDWVFPVIGIYVGLYVMIKRMWPKQWTMRKSGFLLLLLGFLIRNHISMFEELDPSTQFKASWIISQTWTGMVEGLNPGDQGSAMLVHHVGGGMVGAFLYAFLFFLFDNLGASLIQYTLFAIGFLLITGYSYVELSSGAHQKVKQLLAQLRLKLAAMRMTNRQHISANAAGRGKEASYLLDDEEEIHEENYRPERPQNKAKPSFFQLFKPDNEAKQRELDEYEQEELNPPKKKQAYNDYDDGVDDEDIEDDDYTDDDPDDDYEEVDDQRPVIRDFQDQVLTDGISDEPLRVAAAEDDVLEDIEENAQISAIEPDPIDPLAQGEAPVLKKPAVPYQLPPFHLLSKPSTKGSGSEHSDYKANARKLEATLESFGVRAKVLEVVHGPAVTRYEIQPDVGVKVSRIVSLTDDIALALAAKDIRMEAPIPGKSAIGIEVPNMEVSIVTMREVMETTAFSESASRLTIVLGRDISGQPIVGNLARMPHLLVAGATGSGKSVCINGIITSILYKAKPDEVKFLMIDPKMVELNVYNGIPHLLAPVVTDPRRASLALKKVVSEMEKRYEQFSKTGTRNIEGYNTVITERGESPLPLIVVIVDELADLMMVAAGDVEDAICRLAQMARAAGIHLIIATQRPSVDVITGVIKANIPSRIAFGVSSQVDSRTILDMAGAEKLLGRGDMLFLPVGASKPIRVQGAFLSDQEVEAIVHFSKNQEQAEYRPDMVPELNNQDDETEEVLDELYDQAVQIILEAKQASVSLLQRRMRIGYTRAARLIDSMEAKGVVGPYEGSKPREVLITLEQFQMNQRISS